MTSNGINPGSTVDKGKDALCQQIEEEIYDLIKDIIDPEKPQTLEELNVVYENGVSVSQIDGGYHIQIEFTPTVPHCSLAALIGLCLRTRLQRNFNENFKLDISIKEGTHSTQQEINKQINDKERVAAAMENPDLRSIVERCLVAHDY